MPLVDRRWHTVCRGEELSRWPGFPRVHATARETQPRLWTGAEDCPLTLLCAGIGLSIFPRLAAAVACPAAGSLAGAVVATDTHPSGLTEVDNDSGPCGDRSRGTCLTPHW